jgi:glucosamine--fructose-6-phosphate aminotransferase (isomerizing)
MCGIVGIVSTKPVVKDLINVLTILQYRGFDSNGYAIVNNKELIITKDKGFIEDLKVDYSSQSTIGIAHCRWATTGEVSKVNSHPHSDCHDNLAIVHNGIIENFAELKALLIKRGHTFKSQTDSEVVAHLIEHYLDGNNFHNAFRIAIRCLKGSYAIVALHKDYPYLMVSRKDSPLLIGKTKDSVYVVSDIQAFKDVDSITELKDNDIAEVSLDYKGEELVKDESNKEFAHYMIKEIYEQPDTLLEALKQDKSKLIGVAMDILRANTVILTACGTSRYATIVGRYLMSRIGKKMADVIVGSELHYFDSSFGENTLIVAVSQSGETADVLAGVKQAKQKGSTIISIINKPMSLLERMSNVTIPMNCGMEVSVASTKAFTNELVIFYLLAYTMANKYDEGMVELYTLPDKIKECLLQVDKVKEVSKVLQKAEHIYYIGKGINFAVAGECALKLKEVSYIHAESMSAGELKHGTLSLIESGTPVIGLCPNDYTYQETISNLYEVKARKGLVIGISDKNNEVFDYWLPIPKVKDIFYPIVSVIIGQLLAYYVAVLKGVSVDRPKNLAKSVTVK